MSLFKAGVTVLKYSYKQKYFSKQKIVAWTHMIKRSYHQEEKATPSNSMAWSQYLCHPKFIY